MPSTGGRKDPVGNFNFRLEIDGITQAGFREVRFRESRVEVIEYREGNEAAAPRLIPGRVRYGRVVLRSGVQKSTKLWEWWKKTLDGEVERTGCSIIVLDDKRSDFKSWELREAWPVAYDVSDLDSHGNEVLIETLEIAHEGIQQY